MTVPTISTEDLRELLERGTPLTVLDVRPAAERAEWSIPGSVHADAYEALRRADPTALADFHPTNGDRVVTVCAAGKTSRLAAERLRARGLDAVSLEGGMRAWSQAWHSAEVPSPASTARIVQLRRAGKGCLSYLMGSHGDAAVIDASLDPQVYQRVADTNGWHIRTVLETHVHADHLSRARSIAADTGARLCLPTTDRVSFQYEPLNDRDTVRVGSAGLRALRTPGPRGVSRAGAPPRSGAPRVLAAPGRIASRHGHPACSYERARGVRRPADQRDAAASPGADTPSA